MVAGKPARRASVDEIGFDRGLLHAVFAEGRARRVLRRRHHHARPVHPDRPGVEEMLDIAGKRLGEVPGAIEPEADHVGDDVGLQRADILPERAGFLFRLAVERDRLDRRPGGVRAIGRALSAGDVHDLEPGLDEPWHEIRADMPAATDHHDARHGLPLEMPEAALAPVSKHSLSLGSLS